MSTPVPVSPAAVADPRTRDLLRKAAAHRAAGTPLAAEAIYHELAVQYPADPGFALLCAAAQIEAGRHRAARKTVEAFLKRNAATAELCCVLARCFEAEGAMVKALYHYRKAASLGGLSAASTSEVIRALAEHADIDEVRRVGAVARSRFPDLADLPYQLGLHELVRQDQPRAEALFREALQLDPQHPYALHNLASLVEEQGELDEALRLYRAARSADRDGRLPPGSLDDIEWRLGDVPAAIASAEAWLAEHPGDPAVWSNRLLAAQYDPAVTPEALLKLHRRWHDRVARPLQALPHGWPNPPDAHRRLRIGLVSADLREHPVAYFSISTIEALAGHDFDLIAYSACPAEHDAMSRRYAAAVQTWHCTAEWSDETLAAQVGRDKIDILLDLSGHIGFGRLLAFARRAAPVQASWLGYVGTTGLSAMDWLIADPCLIPPEQDVNHVERVLRLPGAFVCFDPPASSPDVTPLPAGDAGGLTFAAFHNPAKINSGVMALWAQVLLAEPGSTIRFVYDGYQFPSVQARIRDGFAAFGVDPARLVFRGRLKRHDLLLEYGQTDIALDPFPYNGMTTTIEALWMGVPVVTLPGATFAGRHSLSHLTAVGLTGLIARDAADYAGIVHALGQDRGGLAEMRAGLRQKLLASPLCDAGSFAFQFAAALRRMWREWVEAQSIG